MSIDTQISSYLVPRSLWQSGYLGTAPLASPVRDALDIERRWRKGVLLRNEATRYAICCKRLQGLVREMAIRGAPIVHIHVWGTDQQTEQGAPRAVAYMATMEYLRGSYQPKRSHGKSLDDKANLKYDRLEAIFHPPGERLLAHLQLFVQVVSESRLAEMCTYAVRKAQVLVGSCVVSAVECEAAIRQRYKLLVMAAEQDCGLVDVLDLV